MAPLCSTLIILYSIKRENARKIEKNFSQKFNPKIVQIDENKRAGREMKKVHIKIKKVHTKRCKYDIIYKTMETEGETFEIRKILRTEKEPS